MRKKTGFIVGLESCTDIRAEMDLNAIEHLAKSTKSGLGKELGRALIALKKGEDGEAAIDGKDTGTLLSEIKNAGIKVTKQLGGNAALESSQLISLGAAVHFAGNFFLSEKEAMPDEIFFGKADFRYAHRSGMNPRSIILQHKNSRYILSDGSGRRIESLKKYIASLPGIVRKLRAEEKISAISLPGWHVVFADGVADEDERLVKKALSEIKKSGMLMFTDTGGFGTLLDRDIEKLWHIYGAFDVVGMNEFELKRICDALKISSKNIGAAMAGLLKKNRSHTIWLHTRDFQASASKKFGEGLLRYARENAAAAGVLHVEGRQYPGAKEIFARKKSGRRVRIAAVKNHFDCGRKAFQASLEKSAALPDGISFSVTPSFAARKLECEVGAGDISAATYLWSLTSLRRA